MEKHVQRYDDIKRPFEPHIASTDRAQLNWNSATKAQFEKEQSDYNNFQSFKARLMGLKEDNYGKNQPSRKLPGIHHTISPKMNKASSHIRAYHGMKLNLK